MKNILLFISISLYQHTNAQITSNNWLLGGNISLANTRNTIELTSQNSYYDVQINPNIGYFLMDKFAVGLKTSITFLGLKAIGTDSYTKYNTYDIGPFFRYYFLPTDNTINLLAEGAYQYGYFGDGNINDSKNTFAFSTGAVAFFNSSVGMEFLISYASYRSPGFSGSNGTIQLGIGLQVHLEKK